MYCEDCSNCGNSCQPLEADTPPLFCMNCEIEHAPCLVNCKNKAIEVLGGAITINFDKCIRCKTCESLCPIGAIKI